MTDNASTVGFGPDPSRISVKDGSQEATAGQLTRQAVGLV